MWLRRLLWWVNGHSLDEAVAELQNQTVQLREATAELRQKTQLWEDERMRNVWLQRPPDDATREMVALDDKLTNWLWHAAFAPCRKTGDWDLLNACAGIAQAIRTEGVPLSAGLRAAAAPARSGGPDAGSE